MRCPTPNPSPGRGTTFSRIRCYAAHPRTPWEREGESVVALAQDSLQRPHESGSCLRSRLGVPPYAAFSTRKDLYKVAVLQPAHPRTPWEREGESVVALAQTDEPSQLSSPSLGKGWGWGLASFEKKYWAHTQ
jgi:hypothetical protein